ncbi:hypothetical protein CBOM_07707 [Ceraceosorus bombacis]|uniref:Uncharacterized protein n=1 Tax=Ceraceosorus bombacis TaxID=401625 RepID=A0A0P1BGI3_9BASI|nr:hypothetical protein CBOM_07707 [Ceraceosorus bombacis]
MIQVGWSGCDRRGLQVSSKGVCSFSRMVKRVWKAKSADEWCLNVGGSQAKPKGQAGQMEGGGGG